jgi:hypothetical protein
MVAPFRLATHSPSRTSSRAGLTGVLLAITVVLMLVPHRLHIWAQNTQLSPRLNWLFTWGYAIVWTIFLIFLLDEARCQRRRLYRKLAVALLPDCEANTLVY